MARLSKHQQNALPALILTSITLALYGAIFLIELFPPEHTGTNYITVHIIATALMLAVWRWNKFSVKAIVIAGIAARLLMFAAPDLTSNDMERYLWDGAVAAEGFDPYVVSPDNEDVSHLRDIWPTPIEHEKYATIYPPASLALFALSASAGPTLGPWIWKAIATLAGIGALFVMAHVLARRGSTRHLPLFALSPLLILETGVGGHVDTFSVLAVAAAIFAIDRGRWFLVGTILGLGAAIKYLPIVLIGPLVLANSPKTAMKILLGLCGALGLIYALTFWAGLTPIGIVGIFFEKWRFGSPIYSALETMFSDNALHVLLAIFAVSMLAIAAIAAHQKRLIFAMTLTLATPLLLSPVVFPWYLMALVPLVALKPSATLLAWLSAAPLGYVVLNNWVANGIWEPAQWTLWAIAAAVVIGLFADIRVYLFNARQPTLGATIATLK